MVTFCFLCAMRGKRFQQNTTKRIIFSSYDSSEYQRVRGCKGLFRLQLLEKVFRQLSNLEITTPYKYVFPVILTEKIEKKLPVSTAGLFFHKNGFW